MSLRRNAISFAASSLAVQISFFLLPPAMASSPPANLLIVPGRSVGNVSIGAPEASVRQLLGKPSQNHKKDQWIEYSSKGNELDIFFAKGAVSEIRFTSPVFKTNDGLSLATYDKPLWHGKFKFGKLQWRFMNLRQQLKTGGFTIYELNADSGDPDYKHKLVGVVHTGAKPTLEPLALENEPEAGWQPWNGDSATLFDSVKQPESKTVGSEQ